MQVNIGFLDATCATSSQALLITKNDLKMFIITAQGSLEYGFRELIQPWNLNEIKAR